MKTAIIAGPPGSGKSSLIASAARLLEGKVRVWKMDTLTADEDSFFEARGIKCGISLGEDYCVDHIGFLEFAGIFNSALESGVDYLLIETAGLCGRCAPFFKGVAGVCVLSYTSNTSLPRKLRPIVSGAGIICATRGDLIAFSERQVFRNRIKTVNPRAGIIDFNGITGEGAAAAVSFLQQIPHRNQFVFDAIMSRPPKGYCKYCQEPVTRLVPDNAMKD